MTGPSGQSARRLSRGEEPGGTCQRQSLEVEARYWRETEEGAPIVHPVLLLQMSPRTRSPSWSLAPGMGSVLGREHTEFLAPGRVGHTFRVEWQVLEVYEKRGRSYHNTETLIHDDSGVTILRRQLHFTFFMRNGVSAKEKP